MYNTFKITSFFTVIILTFIFSFGRAEIINAQSTPTTKDSYSILTNGDVTYKMLEPLPCLDGKDCNTGIGAKTMQSKDLATYINGLFKLAIGIATLLAMIMITWGGFEYATSDAISGKSAGKDKIQNALIGLILVLLSYIILYTIDPRLVTFNTALDPVTIRDADAIVFDQMGVQRLAELGEYRASSSAKKLELMRDIEQTKAELAHAEYTAQAYDEGDPEKKKYLDDLALAIKNKLIEQEATLAAISAFKNSTAQFHNNVTSNENAGIFDYVPVFGGATKKNSTTLDTDSGMLVPAKVIDGEAIEIENPSDRNSTAYKDIDEYFDKLKNNYSSNGGNMTAEQLLIVDRKKEFAHKISELEFNGQAAQTIIEDVNNGSYKKALQKINNGKPIDDLLTNSEGKALFIDHAQKYENKIKANINNIESSSMTAEDKQLYKDRAVALLKQIETRKSQIK